MTIYDIAGLEIGNDEEFQRFFDKTYALRKPPQVLIISERQLSFIGDSYGLYGVNTPNDDGTFREALFFDGPMGQIELRIEGEDDEAQA